MWVLWLVLGMRPSCLIGPQALTLWIDLSMKETHTLQNQLISFRCALWQLEQQSRLLAYITLQHQHWDHTGESWTCCHSNSWEDELRVAVTESGGRRVLDVFGFGSVLGAPAGSGSGTEDLVAAAAGCAPPGSGSLCWQKPDTGSTTSPPGSHHKPCPMIAPQTWSSSVSASSPASSGGWPLAGWRWPLTWGLCCCSPAPGTSPPEGPRGGTADRPGPQTSEFFLRGWRWAVTWRAAVGPENTAIWRAAVVDRPRCTPSPSALAIPQRGSVGAASRRWEFQFETRHTCGTEWLWRFQVPVASGRAEYWGRLPWECSSALLERSYWWWGGRGTWRWQP